MIALGTNPPLDEISMRRLVGIPDEIKIPSNLFNYNCKGPDSLTTIGVIQHDEIREFADKYGHPSLQNQITICLNKAVLDYDHIIILRPTFPHEEVGFSGGAKYLIPGISGEDMIIDTH
jgi:lactate racemase